MESNRRRKKSKGLKDKIRENGQASGDKDALLIFHASALIHEEALVIKLLQSPSSDVLTSSAFVYLHSDEPKKLEVVQGKVFFFGPAPDNVISLCHVNKRVRRAPKGFGA